MGLLFAPLLSEETPGCRAAPTVPISGTLAGIRYDRTRPLAAQVTPLFDTKKPPTEARTFRVSYNGAKGSVPALLTIPGKGGKTAKRPPVVLLVHGLGGSKSSMLLLAVAFARRGYATFAPDLPEHGDRRRGGDATIATMSLLETRRSVAVGVTDLRRGVDFLQTRPEIDGGKIGLVGVSLGGIYGAVLAGIEPRIAGTVLWSAGGDWGKLLTESRQRLAIRRRENGLPDAETINKTLRDVDPVTYAPNIAPRPLLLLTGTSDSIVPNACTEALYDAAREPKRLERFSGGHVPDPRGLTVRTLRFFDETLKRRQ